MKKKRQSYCQIEHVELRRLLSAIFVSSAATGGGNAGTSWTNAYTDLQLALAEANTEASSSNPIVIEVGQGTYKPTLPSGRAATFHLIDNVSIQGGYAGTGQSNPDARNTATFPTILSGDLGTVGNNSDNSYNVVSVTSTDSTAVLDGFTVSGGNANGTVGQFTSDSGGGIYDNGAGATISNCIITGNTASFGGGGVFNISSSMTLSNCTISGNTAGTSGGGLYDRFSTLSLTGCTITANHSDGSGGGMLNGGETSDTLLNCTFADNTATFDGGGIDETSSSTQTLTNCSFTGNSASQGGGMRCQNSSLPTLISCTFSGNSATGNGGAMDNESSSPALTNCTLTGNTASNLGGGIFDSDSSDVLTDCVLTGNSANRGGALYGNNSPTQLTNCVISGNSATDAGGAVYLNSSDSILLNCTLSGNSAANSGGGIFNNSSSPSITNCIFWNDSASNYNEIAQNTGTTTITFSDVDQSGITGTDDIDVDPHFLRNAGTNGPTDFGNLHLRPNSSAIDIGSNSAISGTATDADGKPRIVNNTVDLGAYEYQILFVDSHATGLGNGTSWANAFTDLQSTLVGDTDGTPIDVAQGTYYPTSGSSFSATFQLKDGVAIYGGFAGDTTSTPGTRDPKLFPTILSGNLGDQGTNSDNSNNVVTGSGTDATAVLDGFTITDGNAKGGSGKQYGGGGIYDNDGSPTINDCIITGNQSSVDSGGGVYNIGGSSPMITNTTISNNSAFSVGGGIDNRNGSPTLINCSITGNTARAAGAGVYDYAAATFIDCLIAGNTTTGINGNSATGNGGGIYTGNTGVLTLINCTVAQNSAPHVGGIYNQSSGAPIITNSILWGDSPNEIVSSHAPNITYSDIDQSGFAGSNHNLDIDPLFVNAAGNDFRLETNSPAVDTGLNFAISGTNTDLNGSPRIANGTVDMGVYEFQHIIYVDANATGTNSGGSWADAFTTLTAALALTIPGSGQIIHVAQGTYKPTTSTTRTVSFQLLDDVSLYGGFAGDTTANPGLRDPSLYPSILSGEIGASGISDNSYHVVNSSNVTASTVLDGFTITAGNANGTNANSRGGGIYNHAGSPTINDCTITGNAAVKGGGMYSTHLAPVITNSLITGNTATNGGGLYGFSTRFTLTDDVLAGNSADRGGAIDAQDAFVTLINCTVSGNTAITSGGGLYTTLTTPTLTNDIFWGDSAPAANELYIATSDTNITITFSDIDQAGYAGSNNNLDTDPLFIDPAQHNYRIKVVSPVANAGLNSAIAGTSTDLDGNPRIINTTVDLGAYETWPIIYVDASATGTNDGTSFANAFTTLTAALAHAQFNSGETIYVAQGTYKPTTGADRTASFGLIDGVDIDGGFAGDTTANPGQRDVALFTTILSGDIGNAGDNSDNSYHVVTGSGTNNTASLDGFTITGGNSGDTHKGGGITNYYGSPSISHCTITGNTAEVGGGIYDGHSSPILYDCVISQNAANSGGGIENEYYSSPTISDCTITENTALGNVGGGIDNFASSSPTLTDCSITDNQAVNGGGISVNSGDCSPVLADCIISGNTASDQGGGISNHGDVSLVNCVISGNAAQTSGGGIYDNGGASIALTNCTISGNNGGQQGGAIDNTVTSSATLSNSILWGDTAANSNEIYDDSASSVTVTFSDVQGSFGDTGNINADPQFVRPVGTNGVSDFGDLHILDTSPAVNVGSNAAISGTTTDLDGNARIIAGTVDMGAYEARLIHLAFDVSPPGNISAGGSFGAEVDIEDGDGNDVTTFDNSSVTLQIASGPAGASLHGTQTATVQNGEALFSGVNITQAGTYTLSGSDGSLTGATSNSFTVAPGAASDLVFANVHQDETAGIALPPVEVAIEDSYGNIVTSDNSTITLSAPPANGLTGTLTANAQDGVATFNNVLLTKVSTSAALTATEDSLTGISNEITIAPGPAALFSFSQQPTNISLGATLPDVVVSIVDAYGNLAAPENATVLLGITDGPSATLIGTTSLTEDSNTFTFSGLSLNQPGTYVLEVRGPLTAAISHFFTITANSVPTTLSITTEPSNGIAGQALAAVAIKVEDQFGDPLVFSNVTLSIASGASGSHLTGTTTVATSLNGIAIFSNLELDRAGSYILTASDGSLSPVTTNSFTITYAGPQLVFSTQPTNIVAGAKIPAFHVSPEDITGNPLTSNKSKITIRSSAGKLLGTSTASVKNGVAIFKNLSFQQAGSYTFQVTDAGFGSALSNTISVAPAAAAKMAFNPQPSNVVHGTPFNVSVELTDKYGNAVDDGSTVDLVLGSHPNTAASLNLSTTVSDGFADFDGITLDAAGNYTLKASDGKSKATSKKFVVS